MSYIKNKIAFEEPIEADGEYNYVFVVDDVFGPYYDVTNVYSWLPAECDFVSPMSLDDLEDDAIFKELSPVISRTHDQINVTISTEKLRKYLLDCIDRMRPNLQNLENTIRQKVHDPSGLQQALSPLYDPLDFRIQDHCHQYDFVSWLYGKLVEADKSKAEYISFSIDQVYYFHY